MTFPILASLLVRLVVLLPFQLLRLSLDRKSGSAGMPRPTSYAVFCLKKKTLPGKRRQVGILRRLLFEHALFGKPLHTFPDHALSGRPSWRQVRGRIGRRRDLHQDRLDRGCDFDAVLLEALLHAAVEFALDRPAARLRATDL